MRNVILIVGFIVAGCTSASPTQQHQLLKTWFVSPARVHEALGPPRQQMQEGGHLVEEYDLGPERVTVQYEWQQAGAR
jgi:hypothetical protein